MKNHFTSAVIVLIVCAAFTSLSSNVSAQCKGFAKQQITMLSPFVYSGTTNSTILMPGDHSELSLTFYSGQTYRVIMKSADNPGTVSFTIKDANGNLVYKSDKTQQADYYDFTSESTQLLTIDMVVADNSLMADAGTPPSQCVVVLVGHKE
jgi:hypothetical protein